LPSNGEAEGERFNSFTTHFSPGNLQATENDPNDPGAAGAQLAFIRPICPDRYRGLGHQFVVNDEVPAPHLSSMHTEAITWHGTRIGIAIRLRV
jgi:hypothetical protein